MSMSMACRTGARGSASSSGASRRTATPFARARRSCSPQAPRALDGRLPRGRVPRGLLADSDRPQPLGVEKLLFHREETDPSLRLTRFGEEVLHDSPVRARLGDRGPRDDPRPGGLDVRDARVFLVVEGVLESLLEHLERRRVPSVPPQEGEHATARRVHLRRVLHGATPLSGGGVRGRYGTGG